MGASFMASVTVGRSVTLVNCQEPEGSIIHRGTVDFRVIVTSRKDLLGKGN